ncbi:MAG: hypothetical protein HYV63_01490 [Candidatus Schekmanbacteria bacterium]|nr:hypothetical protein [Candidatus Schekmanbacteria bacterium]
MPIDAFFDGLITCHDATRGEKIFGSMHGYHGAAGKKPCEQRGGLFSYMTRHPVTRMDSYIVMMADLYLRDQGEPIPNEAVPERLANPRSEQERRDLWTIFSEGCDSFFYYDRELFLACGAELGIKTEELVNSPAYFRASVWPRITNSLELTDEYLRDIYGIGRIGVHRKRPVSWQNAWAGWPDSYRGELWRQFERYEMKQVANAFDYQMSLT